MFKKIAYEFLENHSKPLNLKKNIFIMKLNQMSNFQFANVFLIRLAQARQQRIYCSKNSHMF